jgi:hypothetical protein
MMNYLSALVTGLLLVIMPFFTGCGSGEPGNQSAASNSATATVSLSWTPVADQVPLFGPFSDSHVS